MQALDRKLLRELFHLRGQAIAIALVVACGIASLVTSMSAYDSLKLSRATYYERYRFAQVFAQLKRAPQPLAARLETLPSATVLIEHWGGDHPLRARVRLVEPSAFTKVSALGVEEQRVNVLADFIDTQVSLGDGYRVEARIVVWESPEVLKVPLSALFRCDDAWCVFAVDNNQAQLRKIEIGHRSGLEAEVRSDLREDGMVILHPTDRISNGERVRPR